MRGWTLSPLLWFAVLAAGVGLFFYGGTLPGRDPMALNLVIAGSGAAFIGLVMMIVAWRISRIARRKALVDSPDAISRWQVYPTDMEAFRAIDSARASRLWSLSNALKFPGQVAPEGMPIVVGQNALIVGDALYDTGTRHFGIPGEVSWHEGSPGYIEIHLFLDGDKRRTHISVLRLPVPAAARNAAAPGFAHLAGQVTAQDQAHIHNYFGAHFEAAGQETDAPHRMQRRRKIVFPLIALFCLAMLAIVFLRPF